MNDQAERLRQARGAAGFERPVDAAERFGWNPNTYKSNENGNAPFSFRKAKDYARAFKVRAEWLYDASGPAQLDKAAAAPSATSTVGDPVSLAEVRIFLRDQVKPASGLGRLRRIDRRIPIMGEVAAGLWRQAPVRRIDEVDDWLPIDVPGYERAQLQAMRVVGRSMDLVYPPGRYVVIAHPAEAGLRVGDFVVVEQKKGDLSELTLKEFVREDGRLALRPRSTDPEFQTPVFLKEADEVEQSGLTIIGVVVADFARRERPPMELDLG